MKFIILLAKTVDQIQWEAIRFIIIMQLHEKTVHRLNKFAIPQKQENSLAGLLFLLCKHEFKRSSLSFTFAESLS